MVFIGLGRFHRSTLTHHSLCWGKAGKRMQKNIFFAFCSPIRPPHGKLTLHAGGGRSLKNLYNAPLPLVRKANEVRSYRG